MEEVQAGVLQVQGQLQAAAMGPGAGVMLNVNCIAENKRQEPLPTTIISETCQGYKSHSGSPHLFIDVG